MVNIAKKEILNNYLYNMTEEEKKSFNKCTKIIDKLNELNINDNLSVKAKETLMIYNIMKFN